MSSELAKVNGDQRVAPKPTRPNGQHPRTRDPFLLADGYPVSPDPPFLQLAQVGISFEDIRDGLLFLLCQEAEVQQSLSFRSWSMCHGEGGQGPKPLLRWVASLGHQLGLRPSWAYVASCKGPVGRTTSKATPALQEGSSETTKAVGRKLTRPAAAAPALRRWWRRRRHLSRAWCKTGPGLQLPRVH